MTTPIPTPRSDEAIAYKDVLKLSRQLECELAVAEEAITTAMQARSRDESDGILCRAKARLARMRKENP